MSETYTHERDSMVCRRCGKEDRASEGYPCAECGTFLCLICTFRGYTLCQKCEERKKSVKPALPA